MYSLFRATAHDTRPFLLLSGEYASLVTARLNSVSHVTNTAKYHADLGYMTA